MRLHAALSALLGTAAACAGMQAHAAEPAPAPPAWMDLMVRQVPPGTIAGRYRELLEQPWRTGGVADAAALAAFRASPDYRFDQARARLSEFTPTYFATWMFRAAPDARWPTRAIRLSNPDPAHYRIRAEVMCEDAGDCAALQREALAMRAPDPGVSGRPPATTEWETLVAAEGCTPAEQSMPPPAYPAGALVAGNAGTAVVRLLFNPCGEVRAASIMQSSRDRDLDRAAVNAVRRWIVPVPPELRAAHRGGTGTVPVNFRLDTSTPPPAP